MRTVKPSKAPTPCTLTPLALAVLLAVLQPAPAPAKEARTEEVIFTATRTEHQVQDVPSSVAVIGAEALEENPVVGIADMLRDIPGVEVFDQSVPGAKRVQIRGESGARVLILIDGQKISEQKSMDGAAMLIDPNRIERIEVVKGPASILYGSEAIGGVVNIITKKGGDRPVAVETSLTYDSSTDGFAEYLSLFGRVNGFNYRLSGVYSDQGDRRTPDGRLDDTSYMSRDLSLFLGYDLDKASFGAGYEEYWSNVNARPSSDILGGTLYHFDLDLPLWERKKLSGFAELRDLNPLLSRLRIDLFRQEVDKELINTIGVRPSPMMTIDQEQTTRNEQLSWGGTMQADLLPHADHHLIVGYDLNVDDLDAVTDIDQMTIRTDPVPVRIPSFSSFEYDANADSHAAYLQDEWSLPAGFTLTLGARQTWVRTELSGTSNPALQPESRSDSHPVFSAGLTWQGLENTTLRALFSQGYRFPNLQQLYIGTVHGGADPTYPNPDLDPETSNNYEAGIRYDNGSLDLDLAAFLSQAEEYITTRAVVGGRQFTNVDEAKTHGVELSLGYSFREIGLRPYLNATWMQRRYEAGTFSTWDTGQPAFMGRVGLRYDRDLADYGFGLFADLYARAATDADERYSDGTTKHHESWQTLNLALGAKFGEERRQYLTLNLLNIMDQAYTTASDTLESPGFHAVVKLGLSF